MDSGQRRIRPPGSAAWPSRADRRGRRRPAPRPPGRRAMKTAGPAAIAQAQPARRRSAGGRDQPGHPGQQPHRGEDRRRLELAARRIGADPQDMDGDDDADRRQRAREQRSGPSALHGCAAPGTPPQPPSGVSAQTPMTASSTTVDSSSVSSARNTISTAVTGLPRSVAARFAATSGARLGAGSGSIRITRAEWPPRGRRSQGRSARVMTRAGRRGGSACMVARRARGGQQQHAGRGRRRSPPRSARRRRRRRRTQAKRQQQPMAMNSAHGGEGPARQHAASRHGEDRQGEQRVDRSVAAGMADPGGAQARDHRAGGGAGQQHQHPDGEQAQRGRRGCRRAAAARGR